VLRASGGRDLGNGLLESEHKPVALPDQADQDRVGRHRVGGQRRQTAGGAQPGQEAHVIDRIGLELALHRIENRYEVASDQPERVVSRRGGGRGQRRYRRTELLGRGDRRCEIDRLGQLEHVIACPTAA
jgi:hypothetical protein